MFEGAGGQYDRRAGYYSSYGDTFSYLCPDEYPPIPSYHTFKLSDSPSRNAENSRIEAHEDDVSNFWEDLGGSSMAAKDGARGPETLGNTASAITVESYPNPFNPQTTIRFTLPEETYVRLTVFDVLGRAIRVLVDGTQEAGPHDVHFDGSSLPSGIYFYRLTATGENGPHEGTGHLTLLR